MTEKHTDTPHVIIGTAGHVDHGKTSLIRALTGTDCDTHKEEKQRGLTINLGFAHVQPAEDVSCGIVDVPGHAAFVRTMVSGASGLDLFLLVVAADSGIMPQTREHVDILEILGITHGIIVLTKTDTVDDDTRALAQEEIREFAEGRFLETCPVIAVSSQTGDGVSILTATLARMAREVPQRSWDGMFRMYIDRLFTIKGFGKVVTGSVISGSAGVEDTVYLLPRDTQMRIRRLERHEETVDRIGAGERAAINLVGDIDRFEKGMVLCDRHLSPSTMIDATITVYAPVTLGTWSQCFFLLGTYEAQVRMHCIDANAVAQGEEAVVQIHLPRPLISQIGDRFVLRNSENTVTLGGGSVLDTAPLHHRRRPEKLVAQLARLKNKNPAYLLSEKIAMHYGPVHSRELANALNMTDEQVRELLHTHGGKEIVVYDIDADRYYQSRPQATQWKKRIVDTIRAHHARNPQLERGITITDVLSGLGKSADTLHTHVAGRLLQELSQEGSVKKVGDTWAAPSHAASLPKRLRPHVAAFESFLTEAGMQVPTPAQVQEFCTTNGIRQKEYDAILGYCREQGTCYVIDTTPVHARIVDKARAALLPALHKKPDGMRVAEFRDLIRGNRKLCLLLYALFDKEGYTRRRGDVRVITPKGSEWVEMGRLGSDHV
jgi:selenocysteine-specific elongation factor